ncbi:hypothetical protein [Candidatus Poriferisodalis sp.]|uniref:hypothetical protein n=1 Tax=Candidatus Poriferisodalis sp. TaxID=3101277 RepID=UPI003D09FE90
MRSHEAIGYAAGYKAALSIVEECSPSEFLADHRLTAEVASALDEVLDDLVGKLEDAQPPCGPRSLLAADMPLAAG